MRLAISTKYVCPTDHRGSRVAAVSGGYHRLTIEWDDALDSDENHVAAAQALASKMGWAGQWSGGETTTGYTFVLADDVDFVIAKE